MARNNLQAASVRRKVTYLVVIGALFTVSLFVRGKIGLPMAQAGQPLERVGKAAIIPQANRLDLRELDQGEADIGVQSMSVGSFGLRGVMVTIMWRTAIEKQKRHEFHEMDILVRNVSALQPHFISPWLFQGWNYSFNVSVENERLNDMYYYIARGLEFLAEGERLNTKEDKLSPTKRLIGSPDLRYTIGFFYQNKFTNSDKVTTLRSLFQLSCISPIERQPQRFRNDTGINTKEFEDFCRKNPQLTRRLRDKMNYKRPEEVIEFLEMNAKVPCRYQDLSLELKEDVKQFPVLPPQFPEGGDEFHPLSPDIGDNFEGVLAARSWFAYSQTVLPPNKLDATGRALPEGIVELRGDDQFRYRIPRSPALIIFRQGPSRAQSYVADRLLKEGWFDKDTAWRPDDLRDSSSFWFKTSEVDKDLEFKATDNAKDAWQKAYDRWNAHGIYTGLGLTITDINQLIERAKSVPNEQDYALRSPDELVSRGYDRGAVDARQALLNFDKNRQMTNFEHFKETALAQADPDAVNANRLIWNAKRYEAIGSNEEAAEAYARGLAEWRKVLVKHERFHRSERSSQNEEDQYEMVMKLAELVQKDREKRDQKTRANVTTAATAAFGGVVYASSPASIDRLAYSRTHLTLFAAFGGAVMQAGSTDLTRAMVEEETNARITSYEPAVQDMARDMLDQLPRFGSGLVRAAEELQPAATSSRRAAALARESNLFEGMFTWRNTYKQQPTDNTPPTDFLRWFMPSVENDVKTRMNLVRKLPPENSGENLPTE